MTISDTTLYDAPPGHLVLQLSAVRTAAFHLPVSRPHTAVDAVGASFFLYIPRTHPVSKRAKGSADRPPTSNFKTLVLVHGSGRNAEGLRDKWAAWAEERAVVIIAPLFPCDDRFPDGVDNYKRLRYETANGPVRYDLLLLHMIDYVANRWGYIDTEKFGLVGFSGGGQFAHRFLYLHPERLSACSIGAPGKITRLDSSAPWPMGVSNVQAVFSKDMSQSQCASVPIQLIVGSDDTLPREGETITRYDVMHNLHEDFHRASIPHDLVVVKGVAHDEIGVEADVKAFMSRYIGQVDN